ncbi:BatD family protein [Winogradskyella poriferorum]|uniref:BatD family protein n=1 Tax=Winogradskyella poriferorum TaxID=307627 RepID=UPI003D655FA3
MNLIKQISLLFLLTSTLFCEAQVIFKTEVNKSQIGINEKIQVSFTFNEPDAEFTPPEFNDFEVTYGPLTSTNTNVKEGGRISYEKTIAYTLIPKKRGTLVIESGTLNFKGNTYSSNTVSIDVVRVRKKNYLIDKDSLQKKVFLKLVYPETPISVNDSIEVNYKLHVAEGISAHKWKLIEDSKVKNAEVTDISPQSLNVVNEKIDGITYRTVILKSLSLKPSKRGKINISPLELRVSIGIPSGRRVFNDKNVEDIKEVVIASEKVKVEVN